MCGWGPWKYVWHMLLLLQVGKAAFASFHDSFHGGTNPHWRRFVAHVYYIFST